MMRKLRTLLITGILVLVPVMATVDILRWFIRGVDRIVQSYMPNVILPIDFPGLGVIVVFFVILIVGALAQNLVGQWLVNSLDQWVKRAPFVGGIYGAIKKFLETIFNPRSDKFSGVALIEFPRQGIYSIGFRTGKPDPKITTKEKNLVNLFVPCTPNPTSGFYLMVSEDSLIPLDMTVQEAFKIVISMGIVTSDDHSHPPKALKSGT